LYRGVAQLATPEYIAMSATLIDARDSWRGLYCSGLLTRFVVLCLGIWLHAVDSLVTATIAPAIVADIGGVAVINWTFTLYEVGAIMGGAAVPMLCRRLGIPRVLKSAIAAYGLGCVLGAMAPAMAVLLTGRFAQGLGGGMLLSLCYLAIQAWFSPSWWSRLFGIVAVIWGAGVLWAMAAVWLPSQAPARRDTTPWSWMPLLVLSTATMVIAWAGVAPRVAASAVGLALGAGLLYCAARLDRLSNSRIFPVQVLDVRHPVGAGLMMVFALSTATTGFWAYGPLILTISFGTRPLICGYILAVEAIAWSLATLAVSKVPLTTDRGLIRLGATLVALGAGGFALVVPAGSLPGMVLCALLQGLGFGLCWPSIVHRLARLSDEAERPLAVTSPETMQRIGYAVGTAAVGMAANLSGLAAGMSVAAAKSAAFWVFAAFIPVLVLALICAYLFTRA
jgi:MFS family permease